MASTAKITVALDWTPNTNHTGFFVAQAKGWYSEAGLDVEIRSPHWQGGHSPTPAALCEQDATGCTFAVAPSESVISYNTQAGKTALVAVAALLQRDTSAIAVLADSDITRPAQLDGRTYGSYGARFEDRIVQAMVRNDGGKGDVRFVTPSDKLSMWDRVTAKELDSTWIFSAHEGVQAERAGVAIRSFVMADYGVPYCYSPVLLAHPAAVTGEGAERSRRFLAATARGYQYAAAQAEEAAELLRKQAGDEPSLADAAFVRASQAVAGAHYLDSHGGWGRMQHSVWSAFLRWLATEGILTTVARRAAPADAATTAEGLRIPVIDDVPPATGTAGTAGGAGGDGGAAVTVAGDAGVAPLRVSSLYTNALL